MIGMALEGNDEPIVLFKTKIIPMKTMKTFFLDDQLYGFSGSSWFQEIIFLHEGITLDEQEVVDEGLLSCSSISYISLASTSSMSDTIRDKPLEDAILQNVKCFRSSARELDL